MTAHSPAPSDPRGEPLRARTPPRDMRGLIAAALLVFALAPLGAGLTMANSSLAAASNEEGESKQTYVDRANHVCAAASQLTNDVLDAAYADTARSNPLPVERERMVVDQAAPVVRAEILVLRHLPEPPGDEEALRAIYDAMDQALAAVERDPGVFRFYGQGTRDDPFSRPSELAAAYGLDVCALGSPDAE
jgi:hypothetical protein